MLPNDFFSTQNENQNSPLKIPFNHPTYTYTHAHAYTHTMIIYFPLFISWAGIDPSYYDTELENNHIQKSKKLRTSTIYKHSS